MNTPRPPTTTATVNRTGVAWREFNSLPPTPPPELTANPVDPASSDDLREERTPSLDTPDLDTPILDPMDDVTPVVQPRFLTETAPVPPPALANPSGPPSMVPPPASPIPAAAPTLAPTTKSRALLLVLGAVAVGAVAGFLVFFPGTKNQRKDPTSVAIAPTPVERVKPAEKPVPPPAPVQPVPSQAALPEERVIPAPAPAPERSRIEITVQPASAVLSVDKRVVEGNQVRMEVKPSKALHLVQASAPGYLPFKRTISYSSDVVLDIRLERAGVAAPHLSAKEPSPSIVDPVGRTEAKDAQKAKPKLVPAVPAVEEFGMNLERPTTKHPSQKLDETDPYAP